MSQALVAITIGNDWAYITIVSDGPKYLSNVLKLSVESNGYLSSLPHLSFWIVSTITSVIADMFITHKWLSIEQVRKIGSTIASTGPAIFIVLAPYAGCNRTLVVILFTVGMGLMGCSTFSLIINSLDIGPNFAGICSFILQSNSKLRKALLDSGLLNPEHDF